MPDKPADHFFEEALLCARPFSPSVVLVLNSASLCEDLGVLYGLWIGNKLTEEVAEVIAKATENMQNSPLPSFTICRPRCIVALLRPDGEEGGLAVHQGPKPLRGKLK